MSKQKKAGKKRGRPSSYRAEYAKQVYKLALLGLIDREMSEFFEVSEQTFNAWKKDFPEFLESIRAGKMKADAEVAAKLHERACGAEWTEEVAFKVKTTEYADGRKVKETEEVKVVSVRRAAPPDTQALALWLHNRKAALWSKGPKAGGADRPHEDALDVLE
ncbi:MAG TPA: helix-turn-helix domain-containing protein [Alphaproteobacteria bacterium]|nr:helix-turn-helix domain-containing protein [Alphaproteobacteria bacterium]